MCGIAGEVNWDNKVTPESVVTMCHHLQHRGPDDYNIVELKNAVLGHRRLAIIDLSENARQPMVSMDNRYSLVFNGEIYNYRELKSELVNLGYAFRSSSDTEVLLTAYICWGMACVAKFNGMFAFAVWDDREKELFLARDRFGKKPLFFYICPDKGILFASELTALAKSSKIPQKICHEALNQYLSLGYILSPKTVYEDVHQLEPASCMVIRNNGRQISRHKYWEYADELSKKNKDSGKEIRSNIVHLLDKAVERRMVSDVPLGAFLSGGIDSSSIVSLMKKYHGGDLHTFSVGFDQDSYNELPDACRAAEWFGTNHHGFTCRMDDTLILLDRSIDAYDQPFADNSQIPTCEVARLAAKDVTVVLSGDGADELFAGYVTYKADRYYRFARYIPSFLKKMGIAVSNLPYTGNIKKLNWRYKTKQFLNGSLYSAERAHYSWRLNFQPEEVIEILGEGFRELVFDTDPYKKFRAHYDNVRDLDLLDRHLYVDAMTWLPDDILVKVDRATMHHGLEARCPYLDKDFVAYAASIPSALKMKGLNGKHILKQALKEHDVLPDFVLHKKKSGFNAPTSAWIGSDGIDEFKTFNKYVFDRKMRGYVAKKTK